MTEARILCWDEWFNTCGGEALRTWRVVKEQFPDKPNMQLFWAYIIESNRIDDATRAKAQPILEHQS